MGKFARKLVIVTGLAALAGYLTGILTAPKSGKETRQDIRSATQVGMSEAERQLKQLSADLGLLIEEARSRTRSLGERASKELDELTAKAKMAREKAREVISAVHEGDAQDEDLKTAVREAGSSLKHLREYLKK